MQTVMVARFLPLLLAVFLSACLNSERPILSPAEAVTPLGDQFTVGAVGADGTPTLGSKGETETIAFVRSERSYQAEGAKLNFYQPFPDRKLFLVQIAASPERGGEARYAVARLQDGGVDVSLFNLDSKLVAQISPTLAPVTSRDGSWYVSTRDDLLALAREAVARNRVGSPERLRLMTTSADVEAYKVEAGRKRDRLGR